MSYTGYVIKSKIFVEDVQNALGTNDDDLKTLCQKQSLIKKWAKFRPIEPVTSQYVKHLTSTQRSQVNYGINNIPAWYNGETLFNMTQFWLGRDTSTTANRPTDFKTTLPNEWWAMELPTTAFRLTDFVDDADGEPTVRGYYSNAEPPIGEIDEVAVEASSGRVTVKYKMGIGGVSDGLTITYSDLQVMNSRQYYNMYFGVVMRIDVSGTVHYYLATQDNTVGQISDSGSTLWSMGATVRFKIGSGSGNLATVAQSGASFQVFPVICGGNHYYGSNDITPVSPNISETFIALMPSETITVSVLAVQAYIDTFAAWKNTSQSTRLVYYAYSLTCSDVSVNHYFIMELQLRDDADNAINTVNQSVTITAGGSYVYSGSIDAGSSFSGATKLYMRVYVDPTLDPDVAFKKENTMTVPVSLEPSPYA